MAIILFSVPIFFLLIGIELIVDRYRGTGFYKLNDALASLNLGVVSRMAEIVKLLIPFVIYSAVYQHIAVWQLPDNPWVWVTAFVVYDFFYYWNHRIGHEINVFWAAHVVHHSSEEYNLTTALRQTSTGILTWIFFLPMAVAGVEPELFLSIAALNLVYQFWVHTQHIDKLGWADYVFVTPSNHRVHHAQNDRYLDRNYGGVLIIWDRIFNTFQPELDDEPPIYGVRKPLHSWNPVMANIQVYKTLLVDCIKTASWWDKLTLWFKPTGWRPLDRRGIDEAPQFTPERFEKFTTQVSPRTQVYAVMQFSVITGLALTLLLNLSHLSQWLQLSCAIAVVLMSASLASVQENKSLAVVSEWFKHFALLVVLLLWPGQLSILSGSLLALWAINLAAWFWVRAERKQQDAGFAHTVR